MIIVYKNDKKALYRFSWLRLIWCVCTYDYVCVMKGNDEELRGYAKDCTYYDRVKKTHLSREYTRNWLLDNMGLKSVYEYMHKHKEREEK